MQQPKFSVVISVFNKRGFIGKTIQSVLNQTVQDFEIIIVNDCSTDNSEQEILSIKDERIQYHSFNKNQGAGATRNKGIALASGTYIALLDGDDIWYPDYLREIEQLIQRFPMSKIFATAIDIEEHDGIRHSSYSFENPNKDKYLILNYFKASLQNTLLTSSSTVIHFSAFEEIGVYDPTIKSGQDTDLWIRLGLTYDIAFCKDSQALYKHAPQSLYKSIGTVAHRPNFENYIPLEEGNMDLKRFLDNNRFSLAVRAMLWNEPEYAQKFKNQINLEHLNSKQRLLLKLPASTIRTLFRLKRMLEKLGLRIGVFS